MLCFSIFILAALFFVSFAIPGGRNPVENPHLNTQIVGAAEWAAHQTFPSESIAIKLLSAEKQVVAGMKYNMRVEVQRPTKPCVVYDFEVWDRFGTMRLMSSELTTVQC